MPKLPWPAAALLILCASIALGIAFAEMHLALVALAR
jgi:hypothetical protein